jgi:type VI secretion system secreted protein Hcp
VETAIYMKIPGIAGDVTEKSHAQWIKVARMQFNAKRKLSAEPGNMANREATRPAFSEISIEKSLEGASSLLLGAACTGNQGKSITIECCKTGDKGLTTIAQFTLANAIISGYDLDTAPNEMDNGESVNHGARERVSISFSKIEMKTFPHGAQGQQLTPVSYGYDLAQAVAA